MNVLSLVLGTCGEGLLSFVSIVDVRQFLAYTTCSRNQIALQWKALQLSIAKYYRFQRKYQFM